MAIVSGVPDWVDQGPQRIGTPFGDQIGAVEAIAVHPTIPNIVYAGSVNGGIWKTQTAEYSPFDGDDDNGDFVIDDPGEHPNWTPLTDGYANLSIGDIKFDPLDPTHETLYAAIGRFSSAHEGGPAGKLLRTTNGGETWTEIGPATFSGQHFRSVLPTARVEATGQVLMATAHINNISAGEGLYRSVDGGASWQLISGALATSDGLDNNGNGLTDEAFEWNLPPKNATIVIGDSANSSRYFVGVPKFGVFRSTDGGAHWQLVKQGMDHFGNDRLLVSMQYVGGTPVLWAASVGVTYDPGTAQARDASEIGWIYRSTNFGDTWTKMTARPPTGAQGSLHSIVVGDPTNANLVYVAGQNGLFRGDFSANSWEGLQGATTSNTFAHADGRELVFDLSGQHLYKGDDGGVYRLRNVRSTATTPYTQVRRWESLNASLQATEFYSVSYDHVNDVLFGGTQDNESIQQYTPGSLIYEDIHGGDGGTSAVEHVDATTAIRYTTGNNLSDLRRRWYGVKNGLPNQLLKDERIELASAEGEDWRSGLADDDRVFTGFSTFPMVTNAIEASRLVIGSRVGLYESQNHSDGTPSRLNVIQNLKTAAMGWITAFAYGGRRAGVDNANVLYAGAMQPVVLPNGKTSGFTYQLWLRSTAGGAFVKTTYSGGRVLDMVLDPNDWQVAYVLDDNGKIYRTTDGGATSGNWQELTEQIGQTRWLPRQLKTIEFCRIGGVPVLLVGGLGGVYRRMYPEIGGNTTNWREYGRGLPNTLISDVKYDATDDLLIAGTLGRGVWTVPSASATLPSAASLSITGDRTDNGGEFPFPNRRDVIRLARDPVLPGRINVFVNHLGGAPEYTVESAALHTIAIEAGGGNDYIEIDYVPADASLAVEGGEGNDSIYVTSGNVFAPTTISGDAGNDWFVVTPSEEAIIIVDGGVPAVPTTPADGLRVLNHGAAYTITPSLPPGEGVVQVTDKEPVWYIGTEAVSAGELSWQPDRLEPNDSRAAAFDLIGGDQTQTGLSIHQANNDDWYRWTANATATLGIELTFEHDRGDLDLQLTDAAGVSLSASGGTSDLESIVYNVVSGQTYYVRVYGFGGAVNPDYNLEFDWPPGLPPDVLEANDSFAQATDLGIGDQTRTGLNIHSLGGEFNSSPDFFRWRAPATGTLNVDVKFLHTLGNLELDIYDAAFAEVAHAYSTDDDEHLSVAVTQGQTYYIRVFGFAGVVNPRYDLIVDGPELPADRYAGNQNRATAFDLHAGDVKIAGLTIDKPAQSDWFVWRADHTRSLVVETQFDSTLGDLDLELYDVNGALVAYSNSTGNVEHLEYGVTAGQSYYVRVFGYNNAMTSYALSVDWPVALSVDDFEANETLGAAANLGVGDQRQTELTIHAAGDHDWYSWTSSFAGALTVRVEFVHAAGDVDLAVYDDPLGTPRTSTSSGDYETVTWDGVVPGHVYYIHVYGFSAATSPDYSLILDGPNIATDDLEPNDTQGRPRNLGMADQRWMNLNLDAPLDDDWYRYAPATSGPLTVAVQFQHAYGDIDLTLHNVAGDIVAASTGSGDSESVSYSVTAGQSYLIHVYGYNGATSPGYSLTLDGPNVLADAREPNNSRDAATPLGGGSTTVLNATLHTSTDEDWYRITPVQRGRWTIDAAFIDARGDVNLALYDDHLNLLATSVSTTDQEQISTILRAAQNYFLKAYGQRAAYSNRRLLGPSPQVVDAALSADYDLTLTMSPCANGDVDCNGQVDLADVALMQLSLGEAIPSTLADLDGDGVVDRVDVAVLARNYGITSGAIVVDGDVIGDGRGDLADLAYMQARLANPRVAPSAVVANRANARAADAAIVAHQAGTPTLRARRRILVHHVDKAIDRHAVFGSEPVTASVDNVLRCSRQRTRGHRFGFS